MFAATPQAAKHVTSRTNATPLSQYTTGGFPSSLCFYFFESKPADDRLVVSKHEKPGTGLSPEYSALITRQIAPAGGA
jgi:hypothetical protein